MPILYRLLVKFYREFLELKWWLLCLAGLAFFAISWLLFHVAGEEELTSNFSVYVYFAATTASTVGYGDYSPQTEAGRLVAALWFFPGSLLIFSAALGWLAGSMVERIRRMADGYGNYENMKGATVIVGYNRDHTHLMIENLIAGQDGDDKIVLLTKSSEAELAEGVYLVKAERLDALASLKRAAIRQANKVLVYAGSDAETFNTCLAIRELNETLHIAAFFDDRDTARRAAQIAGLEAIVSNASEALVRAAQDPGAGNILMALSAANVGATIYSAAVGGTVSITALTAALANNDASLIALSGPGDSDYRFLPFPEHLHVGGSFYYLCSARLTAKQISQGLGDVPVIV
ncbi:potassium channel family protein [Phaeobacter inhibens]|uniref:potassium channel family protein n=1 Tax=Phaeobacter inhibens TaxID=221822 RepID=UPI000C9D16E4|nr:ion channel [Phaeobacter inhibens]AUQ52750.1 putative cation transporter (potassium channel) protein [Phaeobacter inhibens]AUQ76765.1 putative cation transporter (potassium channel) protein [Phaeobacter inhibens]AUR13926.1 putative cation transporter (potassium channel) protein [Phaeobacter inhibens]UWR57778.1 NAD-binding protein [Phaeobacter inhibens]UWR64690.1 NAD-binding protein [Phaeobacter inhibens]